jgi:hypothetical protein
MNNFLSDTFFKSFLSIVNMFISIFIIQILNNIQTAAVFSVIGRNCLPGNRKKKPNFNEDFYLPLPLWCFASPNNSKIIYQNILAKSHD